MSDAPIEPREHLYGVNVVQIEDLRVARGLTRRPRSACRHQSMVYDATERRVWCSDCETEVEPFDAFMGLVERMDLWESINGPGSWDQNPWVWVVTFRVARS